MDLRLSDEQVMLRDAVREALAAKSSIEVVRKMEDDPIGYPPELWQALIEMDLVGLSLPEEFGGSGQGALETAVLYEELGRALCPSPHFVSSTVAGTLIAQAGSRAQQAEWLPAMARGEQILSAAWLEPGRGYGPEGVQVSARLDGDTYRVSGTKFCVPFAKAADRLVTLVRTGSAEREIDLLLVDPQAPGVTLTQLLAMGSDAQYEVRFDDVAVPTAARVGEAGWGWEHWQRMLETAWIALAAWDVGCAARALELARDYAAERVQFDRPIAAFQGIAHPLASVAMEVEGARTLIHQAAWAASTGRPARKLAAMAKLQADETAHHATAVGHQTFGGIGFTVDLDMQLFFRRAKQAQLSWCDARTLQDEIATFVLDADADADAVPAAGDPSPAAPIPAAPSPAAPIPAVSAVDGGMDFEWTEDQRRFRAEAAVYIREHLTEGVVQEGSEATRYVDTPERRAFMRALAEGGYLGVSWPQEYGGKGLSVSYDYILAEELAAACAPQSGKGVGIIGQTLIHHGSDKLKAEFLPKILRGEIEWAIGYSEPDAGSDLASLKLRATRDGEGWRLNGQKRFTTSAHFGDYYWLAARTDPDAPKHRGITLFILPMDSLGIEVQPMWCIDGERTNEVFIDDVWVSDEYVVGEVGKGFNYVSEALDYERHTLFPFSMLPLIFGHLLDYARTETRDGVALLNDPAVRRTIAELATHIEVARMHSLRVVDDMEHGLQANVHAAMNKVWFSELMQRITDAALELMGPGGWLRRGSAHAPVDGFFEHVHRAAVLQTIGAGANEIQRNIISRRGLGLPNPV